MTDTSTLNGLWEGNYRYFASEDLGSWPFKAKIVVKKGRLTGIVLEPHANGIGEVKAEITGTVDGAVIAFEKHYLTESEAYRRTVSYEGRLNPNDGTVSGTWKHSDGSGEFELRRPG